MRDTFLNRAMTLHQLRNSPHISCCANRLFSRPKLGNGLHQIPCNLYEKFSAAVSKPNREVIYFQGKRKRKNVVSSFTFFKFNRISRNKMLYTVRKHIKPQSETRLHTQINHVSGLRLNSNGLTRV